MIESISIETPGDNPFSCSKKFTEPSREIGYFYGGLDFFCFGIASQAHCLTNITEAWRDGKPNPSLLYEGGIFKTKDGCGDAMAAVTAAIILKNKNPSHESV